jgi:hypothetical protein
MDLDKLKELEILLENCECLKIDQHYVERVILGVVEDHHYSSRGNSMTFRHTDYCSIQLLNTPHTFEYASEPDEERSAYERFKSKDTTRIIFKYNDDTEEEICMPWSDHSEWHNYHQFIKETPSHIIVTFDKNKLRHLPYLKEIIRNWIANIKRRYFKMWYGIRRGLGIRIAY